MGTERREKELDGLPLRRPPHRPTLLQTRGPRGAPRRLRRQGRREGDARNQGSGTREDRLRARERRLRDHARRRAAQDGRGDAHPHPRGLGAALVRSTGGEWRPHRSAATCDDLHGARRRRRLATVERRRRHLSAGHHGPRVQHRLGPRARRQDEVREDRRRGLWRRRRADGHELDPSALAPRRARVAPLSRRPGCPAARVRSERRALFGRRRRQGLAGRRRREAQRRRGGEPGPPEPSPAARDEFAATTEPASQGALPRVEGWQRAPPADGGRVRGPRSTTSSTSRATRPSR